MPLDVSPKHRLQAEEVVRRPKAESRVARRAQALLLMADGVATTDVAKLVGIHERTAFKWRKRFLVADPVAKLADAPRSGRPPSLSRRPMPPRSKRRPVDRQAT